MAVLNTLAVGLYAALINIIGALLITRAPVGFAVGVNVIDSMMAMMATHATNNTMMMATSLMAAIIAILAKISANLTVRD